MILFFLFISNVNASTIVMDMDTNRVLYEDNIYDKKLIASTTKILTALVVIKNVNLDEEIIVDEEVLKSFGSGIYIEVGEKIKVIDLLYGLLLRSGNDAAIVLANYVGGSMEGFAILMNEVAKSIGMNDSYFINASGLEDEKGNGNISTAYDMALLMSYAMQDEVFATITNTRHYVVKTNYKTYDWYNKNKLLNMYEYANGGKTGYTKLAKRTLVTSAYKDGIHLCIVTLNEVDDFYKHKKLYEKYFNKYKLTKVIDSSTFLKSDGLYVMNDYSTITNDNDSITLNIVYTNDLINRVGYVEVVINDKVYYTENIYSDKKSKKKKLWNIITSFLS